MGFGFRRVKGKTGIFFNFLQLVRKRRWGGRGNRRKQGWTYADCSLWL